MRPRPTGFLSKPPHSWAPFWVGWCGLCAVGLVTTYILTLPFGMMSDGCHTGSDGYLCNGGDTLFAMLPLIGYVSMLFSSPLAAAMLSEGEPGRRKPSPEWGLAVGILMWWLVPYLVWRHAVAEYHGL